MHWIDWVIIAVPMVVILFIAFYSKKYVKSVVDYLVAGRVAGRYVLTVGDLTAGLGLITLVATVEANYQTGFAVAFWQALTIPVMMIIGLTGWCIYRFRETKALSNGQFLEMRYSRNFRIIASFLRIFAEVITNAIGPAIAANFFIYFFGLPHNIVLFGVAIPTFSLVVGVVLILALCLILPGGRVTLLVTDSIQGLICYPFFLILTVFLLVKFNWTEEISPVLCDRVPGESFMNPFDIEKLKDFNLFSVIVVLIGNFINRAAYAGNDTSSSGKTPHEQKMASVLGNWRSGFAFLFMTVVAMVLLTVMTHKNFADIGHSIRQEVTLRVANQIATPEMYKNIGEKVAAIPEQRHEIGVDEPLSQAHNLDTVYMETVHNEMGKDGEGNVLFQEFRSLYNQMMIPVSMRQILPVGLLGLFCLVALMLMVTTDDSRIFNASAAIMQDLVLPFRKDPLSPETHLKIVKWLTVLVAVIFFFGSLFMSQLDYINMFITILVSIWMGASGPIMVFGLYSRFGNTVGAYCALIFGSGISVAGVIAQQTWAAHIYPWLDSNGWVEGLNDFLLTVTSPFAPYIQWSMDPVKFPINSYEIYFIAMVMGILAYVIGSLVTYSKPYNLDRLLHRGIYDIDKDKIEEEPLTWKNWLPRLVGISPEYTLGDKIIAWSVVIYSMVYSVIILFVVMIIWNCISPISMQGWSDWRYVTTFIIGGGVGVITTVWFCWGGIRDTIHLFKDLSQRKADALDNGQVSGEVSLADKNKFHEE